MFNPFFWLLLFKLLLLKVLALKTKQYNVFRHDLNVYFLGPDLESR